jgi:molybdenum cofactor biosynthesis protein MoaC
MSASRSRLSHVDARGRARMVDVGSKPPTERLARARGRVYMRAAAWKQIAAGTAAKGDVLAVARLAGIQAAKQTAALVPLCHTVPLDHVEVEAEVVPGANCVEITSRVTCRGSTGVEMEAIVAVCIAAVTVYDMCKAADRGMRIGDIELVEKRGGRSGTYRARRRSA